ncbi:MAG: hypothetical protein M3Z66_19040, partial [Chloroflexota bacterium]|nr:hypothetical protein [Chloroflexota bacterium]
MDHGVFRKFAALGVSALVTVLLKSPATISPVFSSAAILAAPAGTARGSVTTAPLKVSDNPATGSNLVRDGSFESPIVPSGGYSVFSTGQTSTAWSVVGAPGNVAVVSGKFTQNGFSFPAAVGAQWLDLTGTSNTPTGVAETVITTPGQAYT